MSRSLTVVLLHLSGARRRLRRRAVAIDPETDADLAAAEAIGRASLAEIRQSVVALRGGRAGLQPLPGAASTVVIAVTTDEVRVEIHDTTGGLNTSADAVAGEGGIGLVGRGERIESLGGEFAGRSDHGRVVRLRSVAATQTCAGRGGAVIRVVLVDDQPLVRAGLQRILSPDDDFEVVADCADGAEAVEAIRARAADVVVMDVRMRGMDGVEATRRVRDGDGPPVLVLTTFDDDDVLWGAIEAGAAGFALKEASADDLVHATRTVANGGFWIDPIVLPRVLAAYRATVVSTPAKRAASSTSPNASPTC